MKPLDMFTIFIIAIACNIFLHQLSSLAYKTKPYEIRQKNSIITLLIGGLIFMIASQLILLNTNDNYENNVLASGLCVGGIIALVSAALLNWDKINDALKLIIITAIFGSLVYIVYKKYDTIKN